MADLFQLDVVTPVRQVLSRQVEEVIAPGTVGEFGVLPGHTTFLTTLKPGRLTVMDPETTVYMAISGGFAEVTGTRVIILAETAELADEIDLAETRKDLEIAQEKLKSLNREDPEFAKWEKRASMAEVKIKVAEDAKLG
ncbi:MAG TPA: F0F1 ATP synthase subunit epsilon [Deltaproteobacteria bacterium]|nr:F0F1 ATP synthase subunit epsilon [Deltaproteobacteria bacterium]